MKKKGVYFYNEASDCMVIRFSTKQGAKCIQLRGKSPPEHIQLYMDKAGNPTHMYIPKAKRRISPIDFKKLPKKKLVIFSI